MNLLFKGSIFRCHVGFSFSCVYLFLLFKLSCDKIGVCNNHLLAQQAFFHALFRGEGGFLSRSSHGLWSKHRWLRTCTQWKDITWWRGWRGWCEKQQRCIESQSRRTIELKGVRWHGSMGRMGVWFFVWNCNNKVTTWKGLEKISLNKMRWHTHDFLLKVVFFVLVIPKNVSIDFDVWEMFRMCLKVD